MWGQLCSLPLCLSAQQTWVCVLVLSTWDPDRSPSLCLRQRPQVYKLSLEPLEKEPQFSPALQGGQPTVSIPPAPGPASLLMTVSPFS